MRIRIHERGKQKQISLVTPEEEAKSRYKEREHRVKDTAWRGKMQASKWPGAWHGNL